MGPVESLNGDPKLEPRVQGRGMMAVSAYLYPKLYFLFSYCFVDFSKSSKCDPADWRVLRILSKF